jgi:hypothetical protein
MFSFYVTGQVDTTGSKLWRDERPTLFAVRVYGVVGRCIIRALPFFRRDDFDCCRKQRMSC